MDDRYAGKLITDSLAGAISSDCGAHSPTLLKVAANDQNHEKTVARASNGRKLFVYSSLTLGAGAAIVKNEAGVEGAIESNKTAAP